jgi:prepilin-type N-terminal cleavage/methylation domain-containing protein
MRFHRVLKTRNRQSGYTMLELLIGIMLLGIISGGITTFIYQIIDTYNRSTSRMTAVKEVENAIHSISRDVQMAQIISTDTSDPSGLPLTLTWVDWDNTTYSVIYSVQDDQLTRTMNSGTATVMVSHLDIPQTVCHYDVDTILNRKIFTMQLTSTVVGYRTASESRSIEIIPRSAQQ